MNKTTIKITLKCSDNGQPSLFFVKDFDIFVSETVQVPKAISMKGPKTVAENTINVDVGTFSVINALTETEILGVRLCENFCYSSILFSSWSIQCIYSIKIKIKRHAKQTKTCIVNMTELIGIVSFIPNLLFINFACFTEKTIPYCTIWE